MPASSTGVTAPSETSSPGVEDERLESIAEAMVLLDCGDGIVGDQHERDDIRVGLLDLGEGRSEVADAEGHELGPGEPAAARLQSCPKLLGVPRGHM